jgi:DNA adenine methylase
MAPDLSAPFPWAGGKSLAAPLIWEHLGDIANYVEPFFGSGAVLLGAPRVTRVETVNDKDSFICCFWRAVQHDPDAVAFYADAPVNESDYHARHAWLNLRRGDLTAQLEGDPEYYDARIAGWWLWGCCLAIGGAWCIGKGAWRVIDGLLLKVGSDDDDGVGTSRGLPNIGGGHGKGAGVVGVRPVGITRGVPRISSATSGIVGRSNEEIYRWMGALCERLRYVRVCCGDWTRVLGPTPTTGVGLTGVVLDPPYEGYEDIYASNDGVSVASAVQRWALEHGNDPLLRIALCGYCGDNDLPGWTQVAWKAKGGYGNQRKDGTNDNAHRETIWFSPHCLKKCQEELFSAFGRGYGGVQ